MTRTITSGALLWPEKTLPTLEPPVLNSVSLSFFGHAFELLQ
ncbi:MAG: hypothetical protein AB7W28_02360 [Armatimonadota bacterium]